MAAVWVWLGPGHCCHRLLAATTCSCFPSMLAVTYGHDPQRRGLVGTPFLQPEHLHHPSTGQTDYNAGLVSSALSELT